MKISIIHPSRSRPEQAFETASKWLSMADDRLLNWNYILSIDNDDPELDKYGELFGELLPCYISSDNKSAIEAINNAARFATGDVLVVISDDFDCFPNWDTLLLQEISGKSDFVLKTKDGIQKTLVTLPIMDRVYYERYGYVYEPGYGHMYADQELTAVAAMTGKLLYSVLCFPHFHYSTRQSPKDAINDKNDATYPQGLAYFNERLANGFGIENPVCTYESIVWR